MEVVGYTSWAYRHGTRDVSDSHIGKAVLIEEPDGMNQNSLPHLHNLEFEHKNKNVSIYLYNCTNF